MYRIDFFPAKANSYGSGQVLGDVTLWTSNLRRCANHGLHVNVDVMNAPCWLVTSADSCRSRGCGGGHVRWPISTQWRRPTIVATGKDFRCMAREPPGNHLHIFCLPP